MLVAHNPPRYVSDMCSWVHQALAEERDFFVALFTQSSKGKKRVRKISISLNYLMAQIFDGITRPLQVSDVCVIMCSPCALCSVCTVFLMYVCC